MAEGSYYGRQGILRLDGTRHFRTAEDERKEAEVAALVEGIWKCRIGSFGDKAPIDWYADRDGRLVGLLELKSRDSPFDKYPTVYLNVRKWLALTLGALGLGVPSIYIVKFTDSVRWIPVAEIDATKHHIGGCMRIVKSVNDIEPMILINGSTMKRLA